MPNQARDGYGHLIEINPLKGSNLGGKISIPSSLNVLPDKSELEKGKHLFRIMTAQDGDKRVVWDAYDLNQIEDAKAMFDELVLQGMVPYCIGRDGKPAEVMTEFDPGAEEVLFLPVSKKAGLVVGG